MTGKSTKLIFLGGCRARFVVVVAPIQEENPVTVNNTRHCHTCMIYWNNESLLWCDITYIRRAKNKLTLDDSCRRNEFGNVPSTPTWTIRLSYLYYILENGFHLSFVTASNAMMVMVVIRGRLRLCRIQFSRSVWFLYWIFRMIWIHMSISNCGVVAVGDEWSRIRV
jgi:hypothetical protein